MSMDIGHVCVEDILHGKLDMRRMDTWHLMSLSNIHYFWVELSASQIFLEPTSEKWD